MASATGSEYLLAAPIESDLRELILKLSHSFNSLLHPSSVIVGESVEDENGPPPSSLLMEDDSGPSSAMMLEAELMELLEIGAGGNASGVGSAAGGVGGVSGTSMSGSSLLEKQKQVPYRRAWPVQKVPYSQLQTSAMKQAYQTTVNANSLVGESQGTHISQSNTIKSSTSTEIVTPLCSSFSCCPLFCLFALSGSPCSQSSRFGESFEACDASDGVRSRSFASSRE